MSISSIPASGNVIGVGCNVGAVNGEEDACGALYAGGPGRGAGCCREGVRMLGCLNGFDEL